MRTLVIEAATAACSVALVDEGTVVASAHEVVDRGHAERLIPMIAELPGGGRADHILVDCGPGSFTGVRVGIAAARGLALGWGASVAGYSSLAAVAAGYFAANPEVSALAVVLEGGHGEVFIQGFTSSPLMPTGAFASLAPADALALLDGRPTVGSGVARLLAISPTIAATPSLPNAVSAILLPTALATLPATPIYGRAPDAVPQAIRTVALENRR